MAGLNVAGFSGGLHSVYEPDIQEVVNSGCFMLAKFGQNKKPLSGDGTEVGIRVGRNASGGSRADGGKMPGRGSSSVKRMKIVPKYSYFVGSITGPTIRLSQSNRGALASALSSELKFATIDYKKLLSRQSMLDGLGVLATVKTTAAATTTPVTKYAFAASADVAAPGTRYLVNGMSLRIGTSGEIAAGTADVTVISAIDSDGKTFTCTPAATITAGDLIVEGDADGHSYDSAPMGLTGIISADSGTFQTLSRTTYPQIKAIVLGAAGVNRALTQGIILNAMTDVGRQSNAVVDMLVSDPTLRNYFFNDQVAGDRRFSEPKFDAGFSYITVDAGNGEVRWYSDFDFPFNKMAGISSDFLGTWENTPISFMDEDGIVLRKISGEDAFEYVLLWHGNFGSENPASHFMAEDLLAITPRAAV